MGQRVKWAFLCSQLTWTLYFTKYVTSGRDLHKIGELSILNCHFKTQNNSERPLMYALLLEPLLSMLTCLRVFVVFSVPSVKYWNVFFQWVWKIANLSILRESFYKCISYAEMLSTFTPFSVDIIGICHVSGINICRHDSCNCHEWRNEWYWRYRVDSDLIRIGRHKYIIILVMGMNFKTVPASSSSGRMHVSTVPASSSSKTVKSPWSMTVPEVTAAWP